MSVSVTIWTSEAPSYKAPNIEQLLTTANNNPAAIIVLPAVGRGKLRDQGLRRWLSRAALVKTEEPTELLSDILGSLGLRCPEQGLGALRMWGQTGDRPAVWIAAADPVYLEARLDRVFLHALGANQAGASDLRPLFDHLQRQLEGDASIGFARIGACGYIRANKPMATASEPAYVLNLQTPTEYMPSGMDAGSYRNLRSEVEMALHDHETNLRREARGELPVNSLWLWGGGYAPQQETMALPPLFSDDALLKGYWFSKTGAVSAWPGTIAACIESSAASFVAVTREDDEALEQCLWHLREALRSGRLRQLTLIFRDGIRADMRRSDIFRVWCRTSAILN
jgi:hypothetical protein